MTYIHIVYNEIFSNFLLNGGSVTAEEISDRHDMSITTVNRHLKTLREEGRVDCWKRDRTLRGSVARYTPTKETLRQEILELRRG